MEDIKLYETLKEIHNGCSDKQRLCELRGYSPQEWVQVERMYESLCFAESKKYIKSILNPMVSVDIDRHLEEKVWFLSGPEAVEELDAENERLHKEISTLKKNMRNTESELYERIAVNETRNMYYIMKLDKQHAETQVTLCFTMGYAIIMSAIMVLLGPKLLK